MFGFVRADRVLDDLLARCDQTLLPVAASDRPGAAQAVGYARPSGTMRAVARELRMTMSPLEILQIIAVIADLIVTIGPYVQKIVDEILNRKKNSVL